MIRNSVTWTIHSACCLCSTFSFILYNIIAAFTLLFSNYWVMNLLADRTWLLFVTIVFFFNKYDTALSPYSNNQLHVRIFDLRLCLTVCLAVFSFCFHVFSFGFIFICISFHFIFILYFLLYMFFISSNFLLIYTPLYPQFVLRRLSEETSGDYSVAGDENHYRDSLMAQCTPPPTQPGREGAMFADLVRMGFPAETQVCQNKLQYVNRQTPKDDTQTHIQ